MKVLFIGMGSIGMRHYNCLKKLKDKYGLEFSAYKTGLNPYNTELPGDVKYYSDTDSALNAGPDCAIIANPTSFHMGYGMACAEKGIHMFIEKPLSDRLEGIDRLAEEVRKHKLVTLMGCDLRYNPVIRRLKQLVDSCEFGRVLDFEISTGSYLPGWRPWQDYRKSYSARKELGGGVILDLIHEIDYAYWIFGKFTRIHSLAGHLSSLETDTEDCAKIIIATENDSIGCISMNYYERQPRRRAWVNCEYGSIEADIVKNSITVHTAEGVGFEKYTEQGDAAYDEQMDYFLSCVGTCTQTHNTVEDGMQVLEYAVKAKEGMLK